MTPRLSSSCRFSIIEAARLFTGFCDLLIPAGLLILLLEQLRIVDIDRPVDEAISRSVLVLALALVLVHVQRVFTTRNSALRLARSFMYLLLLMAISLIRIE